jgi:Ca2+:H+ antiporter
MIRSLKREWPLIAGVASAALFLPFGGAWLADLSNPAWFSFMSAWLFGVILIASFAAVRHAEAIAVKLGEPLGSLVLSLAVTGIGLTIIATVMYAGKGNPALARDAMFAIVMILLNGMVGLSLLLGGVRHGEHTYNLQGANDFLAVIVPIAVLGLVLPNFTVSAPGSTYSPLYATFIIVMSIVLYGVFLATRSAGQREYFIDRTVKGAATDVTDEVRAPVYHAALLAMYFLCVSLFVKQLAIPIDYGIHVMQAPAALGGFLVSVLVVAPESRGAARAALANQIPLSVNLSLGSLLASITLTIPAVLTIGFITDQPIVLGLDAADTTLLVLTLVLSMLTFTTLRTNVPLGGIHLLLFLVYLMLIFEK